jgi:hypothetical protein
MPTDRQLDGGRRFQSPLHFLHGHDVFEEFEGRLDAALDIERPSSRRSGSS